jgi:uncharacterized membrane protein YeiB
VTIPDEGVDGTGNVAVVGPIPPTQRSVAPDLARGMMLLFIALANVVGFLYGRPTGLGYRPVDGSPADRILDVVVALFVDSRSYPMFAILFGYGMATMNRRMAERGADQLRIQVVLTRRSGWLIALGMAQAALLFYGDILAVYGVTGLLVARLVHRRVRVLARWSAYGLLSMGGFLVLQGWDQTEPPGLPHATADYLVSAVERVLQNLVNTTLAGVFPAFATLMIVGVLVSRAGWLDRPDEHVPALRRWVLVGLVVNLVGGLPYALAVGGIWHLSRPVGVTLTVLHGLSGLVMGLAYVCLFALLAIRAGASGRTGAVAAVTAVGERSLSCYLLQSLLFAPVLSAWGLGVGHRLGTTPAYGIAVGVWAITVVFAVLLRRAGRRGPFEVLLRRLSYGRSVR